MGYLLCWILYSRKTITITAKKKSPPKTHEPHEETYVGGWLGEVVVVVVVVVVEDLAGFVVVVAGPIVCTDMNE